jgi:hypothetical protein
MVYVYQTAPGKKMKKIKTVKKTGVAIARPPSVFHQHSTDSAWKIFSSNAL